MNAIELIKDVLFTYSLDLVGYHGNMEEILFETYWEWKQPMCEENTRETEAQVAKARTTMMRKIVLPLPAFTSGQEISK